MRSLLIAAAILGSTPASLIVRESGDVVIPTEAIVQVVCMAPDRNPDLIDISEGTAFRVGSYYLSVSHVTSARGQCFVAGKPIHVIYRSRTSDFSMLSADAGPYIQIDCGGFVKGHRYVAAGFARGVTPLTTLDLTATGEHDPDGEALLVGMVPVIPGMSGGVVLDAETGRAVGVINAENFEEGLSWSVELRSTPVCADRVSQRDTRHAHLLPFQTPQANASFHGR